MAPLWVSRKRTNIGHVFGLRIAGRRILSLRRWTLSHHHRTRCPRDNSNVIQFVDAAIDPEYSKRECVTFFNFTIRMQIGDVKLNATLSSRDCGGEDFGLRYYRPSKADPCKPPRTNLTI